jgi:glycerol-3-phosphate dehydrogenase
MYDVAILGAGIVGTNIARELSRYSIKVVMLEAENDVSMGTTRANSAIVHAGYDTKPGSMKARYNVRGNQLYEDLCRELAVPYKCNGSLVVAFNDEEVATVKELYQRGLENGVPGLELLNREQTLALEPNLKETVQGALLAKSAGIVGPWELAIALAENAVQNGVELRCNARVTALEQIKGGIRVYMDERSIDARYVLNCAGIYADIVNNMIAEPTFELTPTRGEYNLFDKSVGDYVSHTIFGTPSKKGKGVVFLPTVHGNLMLGPNSEAVPGREMVETSPAGLEFLRDHAANTVKNMAFNMVITSFAGLRAKPKNGDFVIGETEVPGFINVAGIESPGLTAAPGIAEYVVKLMEKLEGGLEPNPNFNPRRRPPILFMELSDAEKAKLIAQDPRFGRIICRCENITEGEIVDIIHRSPGAISVDGVKRRARPGSGRCQGGFCGPRVMEILARELGKEITEIVKDRPGSFILTGPTKAVKEEQA